MHWQNSDQRNRSHQPSDHKKSCQSTCPTENLLGKLGPHAKLTPYSLFL